MSPSPLTTQLVWALVLVQVTHFCSCLIDQEDVRSNNQVLYRVFEDNKVQLFNLHRTNHTAKRPSLKFAFQGAMISEIVYVSESSWHLKLDNKPAGHIEVSLSTSGPLNQAISQYSFKWRHPINATTQQDPNRELCFFYGYNRAHWFGGYQTFQPGTNWPMDPHLSHDKRQFGHVLQNRFDQFRVEDEHLLVLEPLFVNSDGFALLLDPGMPLFVRRTAVGVDPVMCFSVAHEAPYPTSAADNINPYNLDIHFHIFTGADVRQVRDFVVHQSSLVPKPARIPAPEMFSTILCSEIRFDSRHEVLLFANETLERGFSPAHIVLTGYVVNESPHGQDDTGDTSLLRPEVFPQLSFVETLHRQGFRVGFTFRSAAHPTATSDRNVRFDFSQPTDAAYLAAQLNHLRFAKQLDSYLFNAEGPDSTLYSELHTKVRPSSKAEGLLSAIAQVPNAQLVEFAYRSQHLPIWTRLAARYTEGSGKMFEMLIPNMLALSMAGYSFTVPYSAVGGGEVFIRHVQALAFMPAMSFTSRPWLMSNDSGEIALKYWRLHQEHVPTMLALAEERIRTGSPIIRPLWYHAPDDERSFKVTDQYMLGADIVVAPVMKMGQRQRVVYLPPGSWIDQHGSTFDGPTEISVAAQLEELPYFKRSK